MLTLTGGGIYVEDNCPGSIPLCFYQIEGAVICARSYENVSRLVQDCNISINVSNNTAVVAGSQIYGGNVANCYIHLVSEVLKYQQFTQLFHIPRNISDLSPIASSPRTVCFCTENHTINCSAETMLYRLAVYPGENITVNVVIVGQLDGTIPGSLRVNVSENKYMYFATHSHCTPVTFTAYSTTGSEATFEFELFSTVSFTTGQSKKLKVNFTTCPKGFDFNEMLGRCNCYSWDKIECDFTTLSLKRSPPAWVGFLDSSKAEVVYQMVCPFNYCNERETVMKIVRNTFDSDKQCSSNRTGFLCGACVENFSISASSPSFCIDCTGHSSVYVAFYVVGQLCYGIALVMLLTIGELDHYGRKNVMLYILCQHFQAEHVPVSSSQTERDHSHFVLSQFRLSLHGMSL